VISFLPFRFIVVAATVAALAACSSARAPRGGETAARTFDATGTFDPRVQLVAREELARAVAEWKPASAVVVVLDPSTGAILAMEGRDRDRNEPNLAMERAFVTGSTLKTFTIAAALDARTIDIDTHVDCATRAYGEAKLFDPEEHGSLSIAEVLAVSSNVGTSRIYDTLGLDRLYAALRRLHIGDPPARLPLVSDPSSIRAATLAAGELAEATPLQMAAAYATLFNDGVYLKPSLTRRDQVPERVFQPETALTMTAMLQTSVTSDRGTGKLARIEGARVAGKTGTGDLGDGRAYASFVGSVLDRQPRFVVLVGLEAPGQRGNGPTTAAPFFARIARRLMGK
jgi:cell division protein FtsI (penicillin-binding protein 3)